MHAPVWGLVRAARAEYPQRSLRLVDTGSAAEDTAVLARAVSVADEPEIAVRAGGIRVARLVPVDPEPEGATGKLRYRRERHWSPAEPVSWAGSSPGTWCAPAASGASY